MLLRLSPKSSMRRWRVSTDKSRMHSAHRPRRKLNAAAHASNCIACKKKPRKTKCVSFPFIRGKGNIVIDHGEARSDASI